MTDRIYYRSRGNRFLFEEAKYVPNAELAIVLAERLEDAEAEYEQRLEEAKDRATDFETEANRLDDKVYELQQKIDSLEIMLTMREDEVSHLRDQLNNLKETAK